MELRGKIDGMINLLGNLTENTADQIQACMDEIDIACADAIKVSKEWQFPFKLASFKPTFEFRPVTTIMAAVLAFETASAKGMSATQSSIAAAIGAGVSLEPSVKMSADYGWRGLKSRISPYRYVADYHNEVF